MSKFGFSIKKDNLLDLSAADLSVKSYITDIYPVYTTCISCGICSAICTAAQLTDFNIRHIKLNIERGNTATLKQDIAKCLLCGKCEMTCPRGISNRKIALLINKYLKENNG